MLEIPSGVASLVLHKILDERPLLHLLLAGAPLALLRSRAGVGRRARTALGSWLRGGSASAFIRSDGFVSRRGSR